MAAEIATFSLDICFDALGRADRREPLFTLYHTKASTVDIDHIFSDAGNAQLELYHKHLPKLEQCGLITIQRGGNQVKPGPQFEAIHPLLRLLEAVIE